MSFISNLIPSIARADADADQATTTAEVRTVRPAHTIKETPEAWRLTIQLPGVAKAGVTVTDEDGVLVIRGERAWKKPAGWVSVYRESDDRVFELSLQHDQAIEGDKIAAELSDGVLQVTLPKAQARKPRQITVS